MARSYSIDWVTTNNASATNPSGNLVSAATIRPMIYELNAGSAATPADQAFHYQIQRFGTAGTLQATFTPVALDPADPAALATFGAGMSALPGLTGSGFLLQWSQNQRATYRWVAAPGKEMKAPATAGNGLAWISATITSAVVAQFNINYEE